ncbi:MAG: hypothetical protein IT529_09480 [Burkholderiales bacterium]|nr:hypothetical protein [Burkholderiales bacterium]
MNDRPDARNLLETARRALASEILPALPEELRYTALMIGNAMATAAREIAAGEAPLEAERERLRGLLGETGAPASGRVLRAAVRDYNRRLAVAIRTGRFDGEGRAAMLEHLRLATEAKLAVSNPRFLNQSPTAADTHPRAREP